MNLRTAALGLLTAVLLSEVAIAQEKPVPGLGIKLGDDLKTVKQVLGIDYDPESVPGMALSRDLGKTQYNLRTRGIWVFFSPDGKVETIRLDPPFVPPIGGLAIGESQGTLLSKRGTPSRSPRQVVKATVYTYPLSDQAYVHYHVEDEKIQTMFIRR